MSTKLNAAQNEAAIPATFREVKIGDTVYRLTSKFEGNKDLDTTLRRLSIKKITSFQEKDISIIKTVD